MTDDLDRVEARLHAAVTGRVAAVPPGDEAGSLAAIERRVAGARRARRLRRNGLAALGVAAAVALVVGTAALLGNREGQQVTTTASGTTGTGPTGPPTSSTTPPTTAAPAVDGAVWPPPSHIQHGDPVAATRSFVEEYVGMADPPLSAFRPGEGPTGEVDLYLRGEDGSVRRERVISTVSLHRDGGVWKVTSARSDDIVVDRPRPLEAVGSPVVVDGRGRGYEGNIVVTVRDGGTGAGTSLAEEPVIAGCCEDLVAFHVELPLPVAPSQAVGSVLLLNDTGSFAVLPVRFQPGPAGGR